MLSLLLPSVVLSKVLSGENYSVRFGSAEFYVFGAFDGVELVGSILAIRQEMGLGKLGFGPRAPVLRDAAAWPFA